MAVICAPFTYGVQAQNVVPSTTAQSVDIDDMFDIARPYIVKGLLSDAEMLTRPFDRLSTDSLYIFMSALSYMHDIDPAIEPLAEKATSVSQALNSYNLASDYIDSQLYNEQRIDSIRSVISSSRALNGLNDQQTAMLDSVSAILDNYRGALLRFDRIISDVDLKIDEFADVKNYELLIDEIDSLISQNQSWLDMIDTYPALRRLMANYRKSLHNNPSQGAPDIKEAIAAQFGNDDAADDPDADSNDESPTQHSSPSTETPYDNENTSPQQ